MATVQLIDSTSGLLEGAQSSLSAERAASSQISYIYPPDLAPLAAERPVISFYTSGRRGQNFTDNPAMIIFPIPIGLSFSDGASYDSTSLGVAGRFAVDALQQAGSGQGAEDILKNATARAMERESSGVRDIVGKILNFTPGAGDVAKIYAAGAQVITNPNIITTFSGIGTREFTFKFKMIADSESTAQSIKNIVYTFRKSVYPEATIISLRYPPIWNIRFMLAGNDLLDIPKIFDTYCTGCETSYNTSGNGWYKNGSPFECDISLTFKETRALSAQDIAALHNNSSDVALNDIRNNSTIAPAERGEQNFGTTETEATPAAQTVSTPVVSST